MKYLVAFLSACAFIGCAIGSALAPGRSRRPAATRPGDAHNIGIMVVCCIGSFLFAFIGGTAWFER